LTVELSEEGDELTIYGDPSGLRREGGGEAADAQEKPLAIL
jgi:hypothetical protein